MARLDGLHVAKQVAQIGAVIGREFPHGLLAAIAPMSEAQIVQGLNELVGAGLAFRRGVTPDYVYTFKHALVQEAAYDSLLRTQRAEMHAAIVGAMESDPNVDALRAALLAHHAERAGLMQKAISYLLRAGSQSATRSALTEAAALLVRARGLIGHLPAGAVSDRLALEVECELGSVLITVKGYAAPEPGETFVRARDLWDRLGRPTEFRRVLWGEWVFRAVRAELDQAERHAADLWLFGREHDIGSMILGALCTGGTYLSRGEFPLAMPWLEEVTRLSAPAVPSELVQQAGQYPDVMALAWLGQALSCQGFPVQGLARTSEALARARTSAHAPTLAMCLAIACRVASILDHEVLLTECTESLHLADPRIWISGLGVAGAFLRSAVAHDAWRDQLGGEAHASGHRRLPRIRSGRLECLLHRAAERSNGTSRTGD